LGDAVAELVDGLFDQGAFDQESPGYVQSSDEFLGGGTIAGWGGVRVLGFGFGFGFRVLVLIDVCAFSGDGDF
jgi:hypothetical protein